MNDINTNDALALAFSLKRPPAEVAAIVAQLAEPFEEGDVKWKPQTIRNQDGVKKGQAAVALAWLSISARWCQRVFVQSIMCLLMKTTVTLTQTSSYIKSLEEVLQGMTLDDPILKDHKASERLLMVSTLRA
jgi:hypothetical protein